MAFAVPAVHTLCECVDHGSEVKRLMPVSLTVECDILGDKAAAYVRLPLNLAFLHILISFHD